MPLAPALSRPAVSRQGYFGKLPGHGDFVRAGLSEEVVAALDMWLRAGLADSRAALGDAWLAAFLEAPVWRFRFAPGLLATPGLAGVMAPSVDRAGRYFPLILGAAMASPPEPADAAPWFDALAAAAADAVSDAWAQPRLAAALAAAGLPPEATLCHPGTSFATDGAPRVAATTRRWPGLPGAESFASLVDDGAAG